MTNFPELFTALASPFDSQEVRVRTEADGRQLSYITARTAMNRLDTILGPENWWDEYHPGANSVLCKLSVRLPDGTVVTKADAGGYSKLGDSGDDDKSGFSDSFKRAAIKFGVGRYLYRDGVPSFTNSETAPTPKTIPAPAAVPTKVHEANGKGRDAQAPRSGRALFAWTKKQEEQHGLELVKHLNRWAKFHEIDERMVDWDADQVAGAYEEACRKIQAALSASTEAREEAMSN